MSLTQSGILREIPIGVSMEEIDRVEEIIIINRHILYLMMTTELSEHDDISIYIIIYIHMSII